MLRIALILILTITIFGQDFKVITDEKYDEPMLVGTIERGMLENSEDYYWYIPEFEEYQVDSLTLDKFDGLLEDKQITVVMGTWCGDSHREVPRFFKILDYLNYSSDKVYLIAVNRQKLGIADEVNELNIERVPTFIIYDKNRNELGRIIESTDKSLEKDLLKILQ